MGNHRIPLLVLTLAGMVMGSAFGADATLDAVPLVATASVPANRYATRYENLAGSPQNAASLITGLRSGTSITLVSPATASSVSIQPPTRPMGYGNIAHALSLTQRLLAAQGITQPTPEQLRIAMNGGTLSTVDASGTPHTVQLSGVLQLRSQGMGWGRIAQTLSLHPGQSFSMATQSSLGGNSGLHHHGAIVTAGGAVTHGRAPGVSTAVQTHGQMHGQTRIQTHVVRTGSPAAITGSSVFSAGVHGNSTAQLHPRGRF